MTTNFKYQEIAFRLEGMIEEGTLKIGDKLPSVRQLSKEQNVSMSTVFQAYYHLESKGLIESRPKSGYYVRFCSSKIPSAPEQISLKAEIKDVSIHDMISTIYANISSKDVLQFSVSAPSLDLLPIAKLNKSVQYAIRNEPYHCINYEEIQGNEKLRRQIARLSFNWGGMLSDEDVVVTAGCMEAVALSLKAVTKPGDTVAIESPTYFGIFQVIESLGLKVLEVPTHPITGVDIERLGQLIQEFKINACLFVPNFSNPLGSLMPDVNKERLVQLLAQHEIPLIEEDIYGEMYFGKSRPRTCKSYDKTGQVLLCSSFSKSLAPGYRVGWILPGRYKKKVMQEKLYHSVSTSTLTQAAIAHFLENGRFEHHMRNLRKALHTQSLKYVQCLSEYLPKDARITRPQGGYVLWIELPKRINTFELYLEAIQHHVSIAPGQIFSTHGHYQNCLRLSFGRSYDQEVENGLKILGQLIQKRH
jgi:DNA-binding transcriptional MocR family regulator